MTNWKGGFCEYVIQVVYCNDIEYEGLPLLAKSPGIDSHLQKGFFTIMTLHLGVLLDWQMMIQWTGTADLTSQATINVGAVHEIVAWLFPVGRTPSS